MKTLFKNTEFWLTMLCIACLLLCLSGKAQYAAKQTTATGVNISFAGGISSNYFAVDLQAGYRINNLSLSLAYLALPDASQPVIFQLRAGINLFNRIHAYAGPVRVMHSADNKERNYNSYSIGLQYHTMHFDRGTIWFGTQYTPGYTSILIGMSYNLIHKP